jgi:tetratricopeptide (TPR) repeat protein
MGSDVAQDDWFRRGSWSAKDQAAFFARLSRSRSAQAKAQYLRIQAVHLEETGELPLIRAALVLLDQLVEQWPEPLQIAQARAQQASCRLKLGDLRGAVEAYRLALRAEAEFPNVRTNSAIDLSWLIAKERLASDYEEALAVLARCGDVLFPVMRFRQHGAWALILAAQGRSAEAAVHARLALLAASATDSGLRYHRDLGLVSKTDREEIEQLRRIGGAAEQRDEADER